MFINQDHADQYHEICENAEKILEELSAKNELIQITGHNATGFGSFLEAQSEKISSLQAQIDLLASDL